MQCQESAKHQTCTRRASQHMISHLVLFQVCGTYNMYAWFLRIEKEWNGTNIYSTPFQLSGRMCQSFAFALCEICQCCHSSWLNRGLTEFAANRLQTNTSIEPMLAAPNDSYTQGVPEEFVEVLSIKLDGNGPPFLVPIFPKIVISTVLFFILRCTISNYQFIVRWLIL